MNDDDLINIKTPVKLKHQRMDIAKRAAIFAPFAALTGHSEALVETGRITDRKKDIDSYTKDIINNKLNIIKKKLKDNIKVSITYFVKDKYKSGGKYITIKGIIKKINIYKKELIMDNKVVISMYDIFDIQIIDKN